MSLGKSKSKNVSGSEYASGGQNQFQDQSQNQFQNQSGFQNLSQDQFQNLSQNQAASASASGQEMGSTTSQNVWGEQSPYLASLYGQGQGMSQDPAYGQAALGMSQQLTDPLMGGYGQAFGPESAYGQAASGVTNPMISSLSNIAGSYDPSQAFGAGGANPLLDKNVAMALEQASQNFSRNVAPSIKRDAIAQGQYGGSRGDLALGTAASDANMQALQSAMGAYGDQYAQDRSANLLSQQMMGQTALGATQQMQGLLGGQAANVGTGVQAGTGLYNLGMGGQAAQWDPLRQQAGLLGGPLVLGESSASGTGSSSGKGSSFNAGASLFG